VTDITRFLSHVWILSEHTKVAKSNYWFKFILEETAKEIDPE
jgi:hypothetical protein